MILAINDSSDVPIYVQIRNQIIQGISDGRLPPGEQLPTVRALAMEMGINTMTVSRAYQMLKQEGYILTERRSGARVRADFPKSGSLSAQNLALLAQIICEARINGLPKETFLETCSQLYDKEVSSNE